VGQYHDTIKSAILGVYLHGLAGDIAAERYSKEAMIADDIIESLGDAFLAIDHHDESGE
jgi:NAD(P)H-hydrate epimerase